MKATPLHIVDGHDPASGNRFGAIAASVVEGGTVADDDCEVASPKARYRVVGAWPFYRIERVSPLGNHFEIMALFLTRRAQAEHIAAACEHAYRSGYWEWFNL